MTHRVGVPDQKSSIRLARSGAFPNPARPMSIATLENSSEALAQAAAEARGLAIDAVHACSSGHLGLPLGCAEIGAVLFGGALRYNPAAPKWLNRDRFLLSAGQGSMNLYSRLHLAALDVTLQAVKDFRKLHSITPGHPAPSTTSISPAGVGTDSRLSTAMRKASST